MKFLTCLCFLFFALVAQAQSTYAEAIQQGDVAFKKGEYKTAINKYFAAEAFDPSKKEVVKAKLKVVFEKIEALRNEALTEKKRADSTATAAQSAAHHAYANDLAYKAQTALRDGDRTTAFRLAEMSLRYIEPDNLNTIRAINDAVYYNDKPWTRRLPWNANLEGHTGAVNTLAFSPDAKRVATGSDDKTVKIWDLNSGKTILTIKDCYKKIRSVAFSPDGQTLAIASDDKVVRLFNLVAGKVVLSLESHNDRIRCIAFTPDGKRLVSGLENNTLVVWDLDKKSIQFTLKGIKSESWFKSVAFSPDGKKLATCSNDNTAKIWDLDSQKVLTTLEAHTNLVRAVVFSPDGKKLATGSNDNTAKIWDSESGLLLATYYGHADAVRCLAFSLDGKSLATGSEDHLTKIWDTGKGELLFTLTGHLGAVKALAFSPDGKKLVTGSEDHMAKIWDLNSEQASIKLRGHTDIVKSVTFSPDGKTLATGSFDNTARLWYIHDFGLDSSIVLRGHRNSVRGVTFSPDGKMLATASEDNTARIWSTDSCKVLFTLKGHEDNVRCIAFASDGKLATGSSDGTVKIWKIPGSEPHLTLDGDIGWVRSLSFSPNGKMLVVGYSDQNESYNFKAILWNLETSKPLKTLLVHSDKVRSVDFSPDGKKFATGSDDNTAKVWDIQSGKVLMLLEGHSDKVRAVAFSPNGKWLATGSDDNAAIIWDLENGHEMMRFQGHTRPIRSIAFSPDGRMIATTSEDSTARVWAIAPEIIVANTLKSHRLAGLSVSQLKAYKIENILELRPENESLLVEEKNDEIIAGFAEIYAEQTRNSQQLERTAPSYARAERLYRAAASLSADSIFAFRLSSLYQNWVKDILESNRPDTAERYLEMASRFATDKINCLELWQRFSEKTGRAFDFDRFLASEDAKELKTYGDYFFLKEKWAEARQLYEKAEGKQHNQKVLLNLVSIADKTKTEFDFNRFLASEDANELQAYGDYFFIKEKWAKAQQLYEKAEGKQHNQKVLLNLVSIADKTKTEFDFNRFLVSEDANELKAYGDYFFKKEKWAEARQLYEKAEGKQHNSSMIILLFSIADKTKTAFDFNRFLASEDANELKTYGDYFFIKEKWAEARQLYEKAEGKQHNPNVLYSLFSIAEKTNMAFDFNRFLASEDANELKAYGDYFFKKEKWAEARQLYEKTEGKLHNPYVLYNLFSIAEKTNVPFDFNRFLDSEDVDELKAYGDYFFKKGKWAEARQLYEKTEGKLHNPDVLCNLFSIAEKTNVPFDFNRFLDSKNARELGSYANFLINQAYSIEKHKDKVPNYQNAMRLREKQMTLDTTASLRITAANEYNNLGYFRLFLPDGRAAETALRRAYELDPLNKYPPGNLAPAILLQGRWQEAEVAYQQWKDKDFGESDSSKYRDVFLSDLDELEKEGVTHPDFKKARALLNK